MSSKTYWTNEHNIKHIDPEITEYVKNTVADLCQFSQSIATFIPELRDILKENITPLEISKGYPNIAAIDGSNSIPQKNSFFTSFSVNALAYLQFNAMFPPSRFLKSYEIETVPTSEFSNNFMHLKRDMREMKVFLELLDKTNPDITFMDGSINSQGIWNARVRQQRLDPYIYSHTLSKLYDEIFLRQDCLWEKVMQLKTDYRTVWIPKRIMGKSFLGKIKKQNPSLNIPEEFTNEIFSFILKPNEYLGPYKFEEWVQRSTAKARKFLKDIYTVYYKPPIENSFAVKLEFHQNFLPDLNRILNTIKEQYSIHNNQIAPALFAHNLSKTENFDVNKMGQMIKRLAILTSKDSATKKIFQLYFSNPFF